MYVRNSKAAKKPSAGKVVSTRAGRRVDVPAEQAATVETVPAPKRAPKKGQSKKVTKAATKTVTQTIPLTRAGLPLIELPPLPEAPPEARGGARPKTRTARAAPVPPTDAMPAADPVQDVPVAHLLPGIPVNTPARPVPVTHQVVEDPVADPVSEVPADTPVQDVLIQELQSLQVTNAAILDRLAALEGHRPPPSRDQAFNHPIQATLPRPQLPAAADLPPDLQAARFIQQLEEEEDQSHDNPGDVNVATSKKVKSGQFRVGGEVPVTRYVWWPHDLCFVGPECRRVLYDDLSPLQWVCGYLRSILKQDSQTARNNMIAYGADLIQNALDLNWSTAKGAYKVLLCHMESTTLNWDNMAEIQALRHQYAQRNVFRSNSNANSSAPQNRSYPKKALCSRFQTASCSFDNDHTSDGTRYRHICAFCFHSLGKTYPHKEQDCQNKKKSRPGPGNGAGAPPQ